MRRRGTVSVVAAALIAASCGGGSGDTRTDSGNDGPVLASGDDGATATLVSTELVWAVDGEPVGATLDYSEPIDRNRFYGGLRLVARFSTSGDVGAINTKIALPVTINGDAIDGGFTFGPEEAQTRPEFEGLEIVDTDDGFVARADIGLPLSPVSLIDERVRAGDLGLSPDVETQTFEDAGFELDIANVLDFPAAPEGEANVIEYGLRGSIEFGNGFDIGRFDPTATITVSESATVPVAPGQTCEQVAASYVEVLELELAEPDVVLLDRIRAFDILSSLASSGDCGLREFAAPVCLVVRGADSDGIGGRILDRHRGFCPSSGSLDELAETASLAGATFDAGDVLAVVPATVGGLPAYSFAYSVPATWEVSEQDLNEVRQAVDFRSNDELISTFTIDVQYRPGRIDLRYDSLLEPDIEGATILLDEPTTIAGRPAERMVASLNPEFTELQIGTVFTIDDERVVGIFGHLVSASGPPEPIIELLACIESSIVIAEYDPVIFPKPAADCSDFSLPSDGEPSDAESSDADSSDEVSR